MIETTTDRRESIQCGPTASMVVDRDRGTVEIHTDTDCTAKDWRLVLAELKKLGATLGDGPLGNGEPGYLKGVYPSTATF
jgi:hypothetical protein